MAEQEKAIRARSLRLAGLRAVFLGSSICATLSATVPAASQVYSRYGNVGLIDMPTARMAQDGEFSFSGAFAPESQRYTLAFQALPWLETSFRYSGLSNYDPNFPVYYDRSFAMKMRLWDEGRILPAVALGVNDLVGTGLYSGEYIVASKRVGALDLSVGMGWGRLSTANSVANPLRLISKSFEKRDADFGLGGNFNFGQYFHGPNVGLFAGVTWETPIRNLTLVAEYSSDRYVLETTRGNFTPHNRFNIGANYRLYDSVTLGVHWLYGSAIGGNLTFAVQPSRENYVQRMGPTLPAVRIRTPEEQNAALAGLMAERNAQPAAEAEIAEILWRRSDVRDVSIVGETLSVSMDRPSTTLCQALARQLAPFAGDIRTLSIAPVQCALSARPSRQQGGPRLSQVALVQSSEPLVINAAGPSRPSNAQVSAAVRQQVEEQNIELMAFIIRQKEAAIYYSNYTYHHETEAVDRLLRILMASTPADIEQFRIVPMVNGVAQAAFTISRSTAERNFDQTGTYVLLRDSPGAYGAAPLEDRPLRTALLQNYPRFNWTVFPQMRQQFFDPNNPFGVQLVLAGEASFEILPGWNFMLGGDVSLADNFTVNRPSDSVIPHVRTDFVRYFSQGKNGIQFLMTNYDFRLAPTVFASVRAGYLESMFAGVGGEILWRPEGARWSMGVDIYHVKQRNFDRLFGFQGYSQTTGHATFYYELPFYNLDFQFRVGRYLAGDWGTTVQVSRRFASGWEVGVFATKTNVSSAQFGEGSFDKGIIIRIPLAWALPLHTQQSYDLQLRPIQRDGGQTLHGDARLYEQSRRVSLGEFYRESEGSHFGR
jgi:hypothetical protein